MGGGWIINVLVAEWVIRQQLTSPRRKASLMPSTSQS
jgi:hypothetical protein